MKLGKKQARQFCIYVEFLEVFEDYVIDKITALLNEIYDAGQISPYCQKRKKPGAIECELHRMIISYESYHQNTFKNHHDANQK